MDEVITLQVAGGPTIEVPATEEITVHRLLELAFERAHVRFTYGVQYYGETLGYLVMMVNENYDSFDVRFAPDFYWAVLLNGTPIGMGIDRVLVRAGETVTLSYEMYVDGPDLDPSVAHKHQTRQQRGR